MPKKKTDMPPATTKPTKPRARRSQGDKKSTSFYGADAVVARIDARIDPAWDNGSRSVRIEKDLQTYWRVLDFGQLLARNVLTRNEAKLILDVQNGSYWDSSQVGMYINGGLLLNISDGIKLNRCDEKWEIDGPAMIEKLKSLDGIAILSLLDWAQQFWAHHETIDLEQYVAGFQPDPQPQ